MTMTDDPLEKSKALLKTATDHKLFWYDAFEEWFKKQFFLYDPDEGVFPLIRWDATLKEWFFYNNQVYKKFAVERIHQIICRWGGVNGEKVENKDLNTEVTRLKAFLMIDHNKWDEGYWCNPAQSDADSFFTLNMEDFEEA